MERPLALMRALPLLLLSTAWWCEILHRFVCVHVCVCMKNTHTHTEREREREREREEENGACVLLCVRAHNR